MRGLVAVVLAGVLTGCGGTELDAAEDATVAQPDVTEAVSQSPASLYFDCEWYHGYSCGHLAQGSTTQCYWTAQGGRIGDCTCGTNKIWTCT